MPVVVNLLVSAALLGLAFLLDAETGLIADVMTFLAAFAAGHYLVEAMKHADAVNRRNRRRL